MSDTVLNLKWRPKKFAELEGQLPVCQILMNSLKSQSLHPALIFSGPKGTGKTSCSRILAKALRCPNRKNSEPCNQCESCLSIQSGKDMDMIEIDGASNTGVDAIRNLKDSVQYMPQTGSYKVYIIDEVHMLSQSAFNALLKTLEEPPSHVIFIMATTELRKIPATVISRCQTLHFHPIPSPLIQKRLEEICVVEKINIDKEALWLIVEQAQGSMRDAQVLLEQMSSLGNRHVTVDIITQSLGLTQRSFLNSIIKALIERDTKNILSLLRELKTIDPHTFLNHISSQIRNLVILKVIEDKNSSLIYLTDEEKGYLKELANKISFEDLHFLFDMCLKGREDLAKSFDTRMTLEMILIRMSQWPHIESIFSSSFKKEDSKKTSSHTSSTKLLKTSPKKYKAEKTLSSPLSTTEKTPSIKKPIAEKTSPPPLNEPPLVSSSPESQWTHFLDFIQKTNPRFAAKIKGFTFKSLDQDQMVLSSPKSLTFLKEESKDPKFLANLDKYLQTFFKKKITCSFILNNEEGEYNKSFNQKRNVYKKSIENASKDPLVQKITSLFQAQVVEESYSPDTKDLS